MEIITQLIHLILHLDTALDGLVAQYGGLVYAILFGVVFCETGLVVTPFLPGDSLLFAAGAIAAGGRLNIALLCLLLVLAAVLGDACNYWAGKVLGVALSEKFPRLVKRQHIERTNEFYERYGGKTLIIARFVPIVRTFAPFVAGIGKMSYSRFSMFNITGGLLWVLVLAPAGYFFADVEIVKKNFGLVVIAIIVLSILPAIVEVVRARSSARA
ncbi:MAG TPA: DedA family protein [Polyangiaceae bacterium]|jgi:membrane-associated protein|nr:DedA family protein [Polyangiaceae bacterium]